MVSQLTKFLLIAAAALAAMSLSAELPAAQPAHFFPTLVHVVGFQGWFGCPSNPVGGWGHWFRAGTDTHNPDSLAVDVWPDTSELDPDEKCPTGFRLRSGEPAYLFSDANPKTVNRQFRWMKEYGIDGVALQRLGSVLVGKALQRQFDTVLTNVKAAAEANHRGFFIMYDGINANKIEVIKRDWQRLTEEEHITDSPAYIFHRGKPVVGLWGLGFKTRNLNSRQAADLIDFFKTAKVPATVLGGVPAHWRLLDVDSRREHEWASVYRSLDIISPWAVGRFADRFTDDAGADMFAKQFLIPDLAETRKLHIDYMAVIFPGYSWHNAGRATNLSLNMMPRRCGDFYKHQTDNVLKAGVDMIYTAMFDEANEGTSIFKMAAHGDELPEGVGMIPLDEGGCQNATNDMYLRLAGQATRVLRLDGKIIRGKSTPGV